MRSRAPHRHPAEAWRKRRKTPVKARFRTVMGDHPLAAADMNTEEYPGFPPTCRLSTWPLPRRRRTSIVTENISRPLHARRRTGAPWAPTSRSKPPRDRSRRNSLARLRFLPRTCAPPPRWCGPPCRDGEPSSDRVYHLTVGLRKHRREAERRGREIRRVGTSSLSARSPRPIVTGNDSTVNLSSASLAEPSSAIFKSCSGSSASQRLLHQRRLES